MKLCMLQRNTPFRHRHNAYPITVFLYATLLVVRHNNKMAAIQLFCTFYETVHFPLLSLGVAHIIADLH